MRIGAATTPDDLSKIIDTFSPDFGQLEDLYRNIHQEAELSTFESLTAEKIASNLRGIGFDVVEKIGGQGVIGVLRNGPGKTVLLRAEMDALPILEKTGLPYACSRRMKDTYGTTQPVMHACGHDMNLSCVLGTATLLHRAKAHWRGTLLALFQPDEELLGGAKAMLEDGLYDKVPQPDYAIAQHVIRQRTGSVQIRAGQVLTAQDRVDIRVSSSNATNPKRNINPVLTGALIVSRMTSIPIDPREIASVTCFGFHAGGPQDDNPSHADLNFLVRSYSNNVRKEILDAMKRIAEAECKASGLKDTPEVKYTSLAPGTINNEELVEAIRPAFEAYFQDRVGEQDHDLSCEDFPRLADALGIPYAYWTFGGINASEWDKAEKDKSLMDKIPSNHSAFFAPDLKPTLRSGTHALSLATLALLTKGGEALQS